MKERDQPLLQQRVHVDQHVAAHHQVQPRERRILGEVLPREHAQIANHLADAVVAVALREETAQPPGPDVRRDRG